MHTCPLQNGRSELLLDYVSGKLKPEAAAGFERHIESCVQCRTFTEGQRAVWKALDSWEIEAVFPDFDDRLYARMAAEDRRSWWQRLWPEMTWPKAVPLAAACATLAAVLFFYSPSRHGPVTAPVKAESVDIDQVERALEDLEMLKQLSPKDAQNL